MFIRSLGDPRQPTLLFLHGFMGSGEDWLPIAQHLQQDFYCLLPDLPGHSATILDVRPGYESWSTLLQEMLADRGIEQASLIGYSLGGRLALYFSLAYPKKVARLVLESANPGLDDSQERQQRTARDEALAEHILQEGMESFLSAWYDLPLFDSLKRYPKLKAELQRQRAQQSPQDMAAVLRALSPGRQPDLSARLADIQAPTLLVAGLLDEKYTAIIRHMGENIPNSRVALYANCGHNVHRECSTQYVELLRSWLTASNKLLPD